jgi:hypothetical protein
MSWLKTLLDRAVVENMCVRYGCTTCGAHHFSGALLSGAKRSYPQDITARGWTRCTLKALAAALTELRHIEPSDEEAVRLVIQHLHKMVGDEAFNDEYAPGFSASPAAQLFASMRAHYAADQARRSAHDHRNSSQGIADALQRRKAAGEQRAAEHRARAAHAAYSSNAHARPCRVLLVAGSGHTSVQPSGASPTNFSIARREAVGPCHPR